MFGLPPKALPRSLCKDQDTKRRGTRLVEAGSQARDVDRAALGVEGARRDPDGNRVRVQLTLLEPAQPGTA